VDSCEEGKDLKTQLSLKAADISRGSEMLLENLSIEVTSGSTLIITGANGVGKSSLLLALVGELPLSQGTLQYLGKDIDEISLKERARIRSYLPSRIDSVFPYSVQDFVAFGSIPLKKRLTSNSLKSELGRWITYFELEELVNNKISELSTGQQQRVLLARMFLQDSQIAMLDEPTSALDEHFTSLFIDAVNAKVLKGHCFIIATHDFELAQKTSGQILELTRGKQKPLQELP